MAMHAGERNTLRPLHRIFSVALILWASGTVAAADPLHIRIDQLLQAANGPLAAPLVSDAEYLRGLSLDLTGVPPSTADSRAFLADPSPQKRQAMLDRLLASPQYVRHMAITLDVMLMERRPHQQVTADDWHNYLLNAVRTNRPYNELAREILAADGAEPQPRPAVRFYLDRAAEPNLLARDVGRIFFGRDLQCAQCHDHALIDDYHQVDYQGLYAFFAPGFVFAVPNMPAHYAERTGGDVKYESVFFVGVNHVTGPKLPGAPSIAEPAFYPGDEYLVRPAENVRPVPKFSRRAKLAEEATDGKNRAFNENAANRLWTHMMGRGLVHPVDLHHSANPPSHPELLRLLGDEFAAMQFDVRAFLRELALTQAYQRSIDLPSDILERAATMAAQISDLEQRQKELQTKADQSSTAYAQAAEAWDAAEQATLAARAEVDTAVAKSVEIASKRDTAQLEITNLESQLTAMGELARSFTEAAAKAVEAAGKLPQEPELAQAAQKFVARNEQIAAETAALSKALEEKKPALTAIEAELVASRPPIDAARGALVPLLETLRQTEQALVVARTQMVDDAARVASGAQWLESVQPIATLKPLYEQASAAAVAANDAETALGPARGAIAALAAVVAAKEAESQVAQQAHAQATEALKTLQMQHVTQTEILNTVAAAAAQTDAAVQQLPGDASLIDAAQKLSAKTAELKTSLAEQQTQIAVQTTVENAAAENTAAAMQAHQAAVADRTAKQLLLTTLEQAASAALAQRRTAEGAWEQAKLQLTDDLSRSFAAASLKPLTPEQLCWSVLQVTGFIDRQWQAEAAELETASPLTEEAKQDPVQVAARQSEIEQRVYDKLLKGNVGPFVAAYGAAAGSPQNDFFATADQALFAANGGTINAWIAPAGGNIAERMIAAESPQAVAEDLYLTVLTRHPTEQETADVVQYLAARPTEKNACVQELIWGLLTSAEFRFSY